MVDREMLSAISDLLEEKLETKLEEKLDQKLEEKLEEKLDRKLDQKVTPTLQSIYDRLDHLEQDVSYIKVVQLENNVMPRLDRVEQKVRNIETVQLENNVIPRLATIESCYLDTFQRYREGSERIESMSDEIEVLKRTVSKHSKKLARMSV